ncbi:histone-lysine N-methyltransferase SETMAR [Trichonephila clavipes]|nr:histone-lysine N-methyltransferase SETMAR [Trichonephila clavipes]
MITNFFIPELNNHDVQELWFQQDGATCHKVRATIDLLKDTFGDRLISRFGLANWPPSYEHNLIFDYQRIVEQHAVEPDANVNGLYYANALRTMIQHVKRKRPLLRNGFLFQHDNARPHIARCVPDLSQQNNVEILPHPQNSPDKTPCDFWLFPEFKKPLRGKRFASNKAFVRAA